MGKDALLDTVSAMYDAVLRPQAWPEVISRLSRFTRCSWTVMAALQPPLASEFVVQDMSGHEDLLALFRQKYNSPETNPAVPHLMRLQPGGVVLREQDMTEEEWLQCGLYREIYKPSGNYYGLGAVVVKSPSRVVLIGLNRPRRAGAFSSGEIGRFKVLLPHLQGAMQVFLRLADQAAVAQGTLEVWNTLAFGIVLVDGDGKMIWSNREAGGILARADGFSVKNHRLHAANAREDATLQQLIRQAIANGRGNCGPVGAPVAITRPSLARSFTLLIAPIRMERTLGRRPEAVVFVHDPQRKSESAPEFLRRLYGLTAKEAKLAALLLEGWDVRAAADQLGMSMNTARTHVRLIFEKTDTHRQAELMRLMLRGPAGLV